MSASNTPRTDDLCEEFNIHALNPVADRFRSIERELTAARAEAEALREALRLIAEDANLSVIAQERVGNKDSAKAWTVMRDRAIAAARLAQRQKR